MLTAGATLPEHLWVLVEHQTWAELGPDGTARVGITALGLKASGELYMCRPKPVGQELEQGRSMAVVELAKSIVSVKSPLSGRVLRINERLAEQPELVFRDPYGEGWLLELQPTRWDEDQAALVKASESMAAMEHYAWLNQLR
ncbi:glycine cleavage system protein H [Pelomonas sp. SE-A7]|uniref:glycine cleavage system protein H n=1 Tax=Pelomonas sp. SE-A7 TaxID=3054953 RepID=UPI00259CC04E|nr:glycine cleavage system protein H [Pelomonas sp. SE-A7]MDM4765869.1 glycine cleavage system protein H [Pelomonas sp. SE-A7]